MKRLLVAIIGACSLLAALPSLAGPAMAKQRTEDHSADRPVAAAPAADMTDGEIRKIDREAKKLTIKHGEIQNLGMPAMTMVFQVQDSAMLDPLKIGDKVVFRAESKSRGLVVIAIKAVR